MGRYLQLQLSSADQLRILLGSATALVMFSSPILLLEKPVLKNKQMVGNFIT